VAEHVGLSVPYFFSFFKENLGKTFHDYYNDIRLTHAVNELIGSDESIEEIAFRNGFGDSKRL
jgi:xylan 1,4-beta-xylosidase